MTLTLIVDLVTNIILLMSLSVVYSLFTNESPLSRFSSKLVMGIAVSIVGYIVMSNAVEASTGIFFDGRSVLMLLTGLFFGVIPTVISGISLSFFRISMGGDGTIPGMLWVIIPGIIGVIWRYARLKNKDNNISKISIYEQFIVIFITQVLMVGMLFFFPNRVPYSTLQIVALPLAVLYPIGGLLVSIFMMRQRINYFDSLVIKIREEEYNALFNKSANYSFLIEKNDMILNVNQAAIDRYGYTLEEFNSMSIYDLCLFSKEDILKKRDIAETDGLNFYTLKHILKNKEIIEVEIRSTPITIAGETYSYSTITDITDRIKDQRKYQDVNVKLKATLHSVSDAVVSTNEFGDIEVINEVASSYLDSTKDLIGENILNVVNIYSKDGKKNIKSIFKKVMSGTDSFSSKHPYILINSKNDSTLYIDFSLSPIYYDNQLRGCILVFRDVTNQFKQNEQIQYISQHDYLTGLYNRYFLEVEMKRLDTTRQLPITIIHGDINGLKLTNDAFGHFEGDNLLEEISDILKKATRSEDIISRWGGDEFIILLPQTSHEDSQKVINRIRDLQKKSRYEFMTPSISLGVATKTNNKQDLNAILNEAETKMYNNKQNDGKIMRKDFLQKLEKRLYDVHPELGAHSPMVSEYAKEFGKHLKLSNEDIETLSLLGLYHDIGWINVPSELLLKKGNLTNEEKDIINSHSEVGFRIMKSIPELSHIADLILDHHEKWDGSGYPFGKKEKDIPYLSRIISLCDAFDMMVNNSVYTPKKSVEAALKDIESYKGIQFDPDLAVEFIKYHTK